MNENFIQLIISAIVLFSSVIMLFNGCGNSKSVEVKIITRKSPKGLKPKKTVYQRNFLEKEAIVSETSESEDEISLEDEQDENKVEETIVGKVDEEIHEKVVAENTLKTKVNHDIDKINEQQIKNKSDTANEVEMKFKFKEWDVDLQIE
jgi:hypothetical protein